MKEGREGGEGGDVDGEEGEEEFRDRGCGAEEVDWFLDFSQHEIRQLEVHAGKGGGVKEAGRLG